jgi:hypothetical protein
MSRALIAACLVAVLPTVATPQTTPWSAGFVPPALVGLGTAVAISGGELFVGRTGEFPTLHTSSLPTCRREARLARRSPWTAR